MSRQINLINPALIHKKEWLSAGTISILQLLLMLLLAGWYMVGKQQLAGLQQQHSQAEATLQTMQANLATATAARMPRVPDQALQIKLAQREKEKQMQAQLLGVIQHNKTATDWVLSSYLKGFARQATDGVWLTAFMLDRETHVMTINGRCLQADLLPQYIAKLGHEAAFKGQMFGGVSMNISTDSAGKAPGNIANLLSADTAPVINQTESPSVVIPKLIEFELQGVKAEQIMPAQTNAGSAKGTSE